ncbi:hypothetical protein HYZ99_04405 [Candidatus Peregrinibacteria bacterium]|nr:hypothetical protein [Candidatus Peregrinibacteria bacterium]
MVRTFRSKSRSFRVRHLLIEHLENRSMLANAHAFVISQPITSYPVYDEGGDLQLAALTLVGDTDVFITDLTLATEGVFIPSVRMDCLDAEGRPGQDGYYETPFTGPVTLRNGQLTVGLHPHGMDFSRGIFLEVIGTVGGMPQVVGLSDPDLAVIAYNDLPYPDASPVDVHVVGAALPQYTVTTLVQPEELASLFIAVKGIGTSDVAVENQRNITLLRFEAFADVRDVLLTWAAFDADIGDVFNATNYSLWVDTDGNNEVDTIVQDGVASSSGFVRFDNMIGGGFITPAGDVTVYEVHADVVSSLADDPTLQLGIVGVEAEDVDDGSWLFPSQITVTSVPSKIWTFVEQGNLIVTEDSTPVLERQLLGGALGEAILRVEARAEYEDVDVFKIFVSMPGNVVSVDRLELFRSGETVAFAIATIGGVGSDPVPAGYTTFAANTNAWQLVIPEGQSVDILVRPRMKTDSSGAISGESVQTLLLNSFASVEARGDFSSNTIDVSIASSIAGPVNEVVLSKITSVTNANPDANGTAVPTGVSPIGQFKFTAAANANSQNGLNKVVLENIVFVIDTSNVLLRAEDFRFYNKADASTKLTTVVTTLDGATVLTGNVTGQFLVRVSDLSASAVDAVIDQGEDATFVLEGNVLNPQISATSVSSLRVSLDLRDEFFSWFDQDTTSVLHHGVDLPDILIRSTLYQS